MQLAFTAHLPFRLTRPEPRPAPVIDLESRRRTTETQLLARRAAAPQDRALYSCACGFAFTAAVSTTVGCPHCGTAQAW